MKKILLIIHLVLLTVTLKAQTTAKDFNRNDCNGVNHHLFSELDSNKVVILEFFMLACASCIYAGQDLNAMHIQLDSEFPGMVYFYNMGFDDAYSCNDISNWVTANGFNSTPFDSGAYQVAYYGGMGMPTVAVVAGPLHEVLFLKSGFNTSDTAIIATAIRNFYGVSAVQETSEIFSAVRLSPNPTSNFVNLAFHLKEPSAIKIEVVDYLGKAQKEVVEADFGTGDFNQKIEISSLANGVYFLRIQSNSKAEYYKFTKVD